MNEIKGHIRSKAEIINEMALRFAPMLSQNNMREQEALNGYYDLLREIDQYCHMMGNGNSIVEQFWKNYLSELKDTITEIISDELNHTVKLTEMMVKFGNIKVNKV